MAKIYETAQDVIQDDFLEDDDKQSNETLDLFRFMQYNSTPLSHEQIQAMTLLEENGLEDLSHLVIRRRHLATPNKIYMELLKVLTFFDRIKGNAKLSHLVKSDGLSNPAQNLKAQEMQAQGMSRREIDRY